MKNLLKIFIVAATLLVSCENPNNNSSIPEYPVYLSRNLNLEAQELRTIGGCKMFPVPEKQREDLVGYGGILIFYGFNENYYAFDMACPYEKKRDIKIKLHNADQVICETCGSIFNIGYGSGARASGKATEGLKRYTVSEHHTVSGTILTVTR